MNSLMLFVFNFQFVWMKFSKHFIFFDLRLAQKMEVFKLFATKSRWAWTAFWTNWAQFCKLNRPKYWIVDSLSFKMTSVILINFSFFFCQFFMKIYKPFAICVSRCQNRFLFHKIALKSFFHIQFSNSGWRFVIFRASLNHLIVSYE